jgi:hypothetical protein
MKVFISWSGELSKKLGEAIRDWLPGVLQTVSPYFTPSDIEKGARWSQDIAKELSESQVGILCVTKENLHSDWLLFEAGALSKSLQKSHVCPVLFGIKNNDLAGPLKQFQTTEFEKNEVQKLIAVMNGQLGDHKLPSKTLDMVFDKWWPDLEERITTIMKEENGGEDTTPVRSEREVIEEILEVSRLTLNRVGRTSSLPSEAIIDLLQGFIDLHDLEASESGGYQDALDQMKRISKSLRYIVTRSRGRSPEIDEVTSRFLELSYTSASEARIAAEESEAPF